jgi:hypothetical protein
LCSFCIVWVISREGWKADKLAYLEGAYFALVLRLGTLSLILRKTWSEASPEALKLSGKLGSLPLDPYAPLGLPGAAFPS